MDSSICDTLKKLRMGKKLSQAGLGRALGISRSKISSWEIGRRDISLSDAIIVAKFFGVSLDELVSFGE